MSSSLKTIIDLYMKKVKYQMDSTQNEAAEQNNCEVLAEQSNVTVKEKNRSENISFTEKKFFDNENECIEETGKSVGNINKMFEVNNKCQNCIEKYDELHDKYLNLESKYIAIEQNNSSK
ncbi:uncharacterized protein LOC126910014 isoform X2 [Daktulosphaira vitifoliae]|uniref:uncharacterized protein LOC126910014 isoform X2 n=1 Tax=Daktulosphaira vitifoliae TaxID=58002 RepID=UPI0021AA8AF6|nr:uncharacterized protein LOC126910014 isoform X2 [Daktulosphaira vitifoliae]